MSLEIRNAPGQPGYALLIFNRVLDIGPLRLAVQNRMSRKYLGPSVGKANWSPARSHFFDATLVSCTKDETVFKIGPEVVSFIPDESTVEFSSEDNSVREQAIWSGIMLPFVWTVTEANPENEAEAARGRDNQRREREDAERRVREAATQRRQQEADAERRRLGAEAQREREDAERQRRDAEMQRLQREAEADRRRAEAVEKRERDDAVRRDVEVRQQMEADAEPQRVEAEKQRTRKEDEELKKREKSEVEARPAATTEDMADLARGIVRGAEAERTGETNQAEAQRMRREEEAGVRDHRPSETKREQEEAAKAKFTPAWLTSAEVDHDNAANAAAIEYAPRAERQARLRAFAMIGTLVAVLLAILWGSQNHSYLCGRFGAFCAPETMAFDAAVTCAKYKTCGANECIADYRRTYPTGAHKAQIDQIADTKGMACRDPEKASYDGAWACAASRGCGVGECIADYRRNYPQGRFKDQIDQIVQTKGLVCQETDRAAFDRVNACAAAATACGVDQCVAEYRRNYPTGRFKAQIDQIVQTRGQACQDAERSSFEWASVCAAAKTCGVGECVAAYQRNYPNGRFKAQIDQFVVTKGLTCPDVEQNYFDRASACAASRTCGADECAAEYRRFYPSGRFTAQLDQLITSKARACVDLGKRFDKARGSKERQR